MYCSNCGKELPDNAKFCNNCGAQQGAAQPAAAPRPQPAPPPPPQGQYPTQPEPTTPVPNGKKKTWGIILLVLGALAIFGGFSNGSFARMADHFDLSNLVTILVEAAMIIFGIRLWSQGSKGE